MTDVKALFIGAIKLKLFDVQTVGVVGGFDDRRFFAFRLHRHPGIGYWHVPNAFTELRVALA